MDKLLALIDENCRLTTEQMAAILEMDETELAAKIKDYEKNKTIVGYKALIDWDKTDREYATALIELKVTPSKGRGFDKVAESIYNFDEVQSLYLMSGGFDLCVVLEGRSLRDVALFVAERLAPMEAVVSTATHFVLKKYKDKGIIYDRDDRDERGYIGL